MTTCNQYTKVWKNRSLECPKMANLWSIFVHRKYLIYNNKINFATSGRDWGGLLSSSIFVKRNAKRRKTVMHQLLQRINYRPNCVVTNTQMEINPCQLECQTGKCFPQKCRSRAYRLMLLYPYTVNQHYHAHWSKTVMWLWTGKTPF